MLLVPGQGHFFLRTVGPQFMQQGVNFSAFQMGVPMWEVYVSTTPLRPGQPVTPLTGMPLVLPWSGGSVLWLQVQCES